MKVTAKINNLRIAPRKTQLVADLIRGLDASEALIQLDHCLKKTAPYMKKALLSALANGENNFGLDRNNMYVFAVTANAGPTLKRWMPKAFGRAGRILKRTSKITIVLEERVEGKGRKTKEQMEKEKRARAEEKKKEVRERAKEQEKKEKEEKSENKKDKTENFAKDKAKEEKSKTANKKKGWANKIFRRKSI